MTLFCSRAEPRASTAAIFGSLLFLGCAAKQTPAPASTTDATTATAITPATASAAPAPASAWPESLHLAGMIAGPPNVEFFASLNADKGTLDIPSQGVRGGELSAITRTNEELSFTLREGGLHWQLTHEQDGTIGCTFSQGAITLRCAAQPISAEAYVARVPPLVRPQLPKPPFPYVAEEVGYDNSAAGVHLAGTLTKPQGAGPFPVVLLITGSGAQDRDETVFNHKPFLVLADALARRGIAALRVDDRGVGGSTAAAGTAITQDLAADVRAGIAWLKTRSDIDAAHIGLLGHSEGAEIAPLAAEKDVAFVVLLAAPAVPGSQLLVEQAVAMLSASGAPDDVLKQARTEQEKVMNVIAREKDEAKARKVLTDILGESMGDDAMVEAQIDQLLNPWFRNFITYDPRPALTRLHCPVLALYGELDRQVVPSQNAPQLEKALRKNKYATVRRLPGLNHLLQPATTGAMTEYPKIETTIEVGALELVLSWISEQVKSASVH